MKTRIQSLEDKLLSKMKTVKSHLLNDIFDLRNDIMLLKKRKKEKRKTLEERHCCLKKKSSLNQKITF